MYYYYYLRKTNTTHIDILAVTAIVGQQKRPMKTVTVFIKVRTVQFGKGSQCDAWACILNAILTISTLVLVVHVLKS